MSSDGVVKKQRLILLDLLRIVFALLIYARHSITMFGCSYGGALNYRIKYLTRPIMTGFFLLSGFAMYYSYSGKNLENASSMKKFWLKRLITIIPSYYLIHFLWLIFNRGQFKEWLIMSPMEFTGTQSVYSSFFGILHNGGTWFVSCILFCYLLYPMIHTLISKCSTKSLIVLGTALLLAQYYSEYLVFRYDLDTNYSNPWFRILEFVIGVIVCSLMFKMTEKKALLCAFIGLTFTAAAAFIMRFAMHYPFNITILRLTIPGVSFVLLISRSIKWKGNKVIRVLSGMSYHFFLVQLILWDVSSKVMKILDVSGNKAKIAVSLISCTIISFLMYMCFDMPIKKLATKVLLDRKVENTPATDN
ncbi:MAG: acyltransferase [Clostridiales bacterium]|nr:acyltransferase [Clostridiales bacterium]